MQVFIPVVVQNIVVLITNKPGNIDVLVFLGTVAFFLKFKGGIIVVNCCGCASKTINKFKGPCVFGSGEALRFSLWFCYAFDESC